MVDIFRSLGRSDALKLRESASTMSGTQIIAQEHAIPSFNPQKDYTDWKVGSPVADEEQVWLLLQPYNAASFSQRPSELRALWGLAHTKDPERAKPWVDPYGTSGIYMKDECYKDADGVVWRAMNDNLVWDAVAYPSGWERIDTNKE